MTGQTGIWTVMAVLAAGSVPALGLAAEAGLYIDYNGLALVRDSGETRYIGFGTAEDEVLAVAENMWGPPNKTVAAEDHVCAQRAGGPIDFWQYANGVDLNFQDGAFTGWGTSSADVTTMNGIGLGTTVGELESALGDLTIEETTLGYEFGHEELFGIVTANTPDGVLEVFWGGFACVFR